MSILWSTVESALHTWVTKASGLDNQHVIWAKQRTGKFPDTTFIDIELGDMTSIGAFDYEIDSTNLGAPAGQEITQTVVSQREFPVILTAWSDTVIQDNTARQILSIVQASLSLPSVITALAQAGLSSFDPGTIQVINPLGYEHFEGRAILEARFYINETVSETVGYIKTAQITDTTTGKTFVVG